MLNALQEPSNVALSDSVKRWNLIAWVFFCLLHYRPPGTHNRTATTADCYFISRRATMEEAWPAVITFFFFPNTQGNGTPRTASGCWHPKIRFRPIPELLVAHRLWAVPSASSNSDQTCDLFLAICVIWYSTRPGRTVHAELADSEHLVITSAWLAVISPRPASGHSKGNDRPTSIYASHHCQIHQFSPFFHILS